MTMRILTFLAFLTFFGCNKDYTPEPMDKIHEAAVRIKSDGKYCGFCIHFDGGRRFDCMDTYKITDAHTLCLDLQQGEIIQIVERGGNYYWKADKKLISFY